MFGRHHRHHHNEGCRSPDRGFGTGFGGGHRHGLRGSHHERGERGGRIFDQGDLRLVMLQLITEKPAHGYELIKAIEERLGGAYSPSPGVVYPTLTLLGEMGYATVAAQGGKKLYAITAEGQAHLDENRRQLDAITERMDAAKARGGRFSPQIMRAMENLRTALKYRLAEGQLTEAEVAAIAKALDEAALAVERKG